MAKLPPLTMRQGLILVVFAALLPVVIASFFQGQSALESSRKVAFERLIGTATAIAEQQRDPFVIGQHMLRALATNASVAELTDRCDAALRASLSNIPPVTNIARTAADGTVRCSAIPFAENINLAQEGWWQRGVNAQGMTVTKAPVYGRVAKRDVLFLILPLRRGDGRQNGTLTAAIDIDYMRRGLYTAGAGNGGTLAIVTRKGDVIANGSKSLAFKPAMDAIPDRPLEALDKNGNAWIYALHKIYGSDLFLVYAEPREQLMATAISQMRTSVLVPLISILLASIAIWVGTNRLTLNWLRELRYVSDRFAQGDLTGDQGRFERAPEEIAAFSADLHTMAEVIYRRNTDLMQALEDKSQLTREVHHRVKNNLQIINSLLMLQLGRISEGAARNVLAQTQARIGALALIHRLLYEQDNGYDLGEVAIDNLIEQLCSQLRRSNRLTSQLELTCHASSFLVPIDYVVPLTLFVVEAVTNAFRHAFPAGTQGSVNLDFYLQDDDAILEISDNGIGYSVTDKAGQMGTELMLGFATQVDGNLSISSSEGTGTRVILKFPLSNIPVTNASRSGSLPEA